MCLSMAFKKKSLGQHFLVDPTISMKIADAVIINAANDVLVEVGPGQGAITKHLIKKNINHFKVVEKDDRFAVELPKKFKVLEGKLIHKDILQLDWSKDFGSKYHIVGNFPYNISNMLLFNVYDNRNHVMQMVGMFQREVAKRVCSGTNSKTYGKLSVLLQAFYTTEYLFDVPPEAFDPPPNVNSAVIRLLRKTKDPEINNITQFKAVVKSAFGMRRKKLSNSLKPFTFESNDTIKDLLNRRPEHLDYNDFIYLTNHIATV